MTRKKAPGQSRLDYAARKNPRYHAAGVIAARRISHKATPHPSRMFRAICTCGWLSPPGTEKQSRDAGIAHTEALNPPA